MIYLCDQSSIYKVPLVLEKQGLVKYFFEKFKLGEQNFSLNCNGLLYKWKMISDRIDSLSKSVCIALVGKYTKLEDSYASVIKALKHASQAVYRKLEIAYIDSSALEEKTKQTNPKEYYLAWQALCTANGLIVPGGFGDRGVEGKILAIEHARTNKIPFLGICLGFQCAVLELCRNVIGLKDAESMEQNKEATCPVIVEMPEHHGGDLGGTMRVGRRETQFVTKDCITHKLYKCQDTIHERHRHRYEVNVEYIDRLEAAGMRFVGKDTSKERMEIMELQGHPFFVGVQFHPEYTSRLLRPSPPYLGLLLASVSIEKLNAYLEGKHALNDGYNSDNEMINYDNLDLLKTCKA